MKKLLPLALVLVAGCGSPQSDNAASTDASSANASSADASSANAATTDAAATDATNAAGNAAPDTATTDTAASGPTYRVTDEVSPDMPPAVAKALRAAALPPPPASLKVPDNAKVVLQTSKGNITVQLDTKGAPLHAKSFYYLARKGFYNGTRFHRWENLMQGGQQPGFIIQGGDPLTKTPAAAEFYGGGGPGYQIPRERNSSRHDAMVLSAARTRDPDSAGSQFYLTQNPVYFLDDGDGYTVFGKVVSGKDVALKLRKDDVIKKAVAL